MPKEKEGYRDQLEDVAAFFGPKRLLTVTDVSRYLGRDRDYVIRRFHISNPKDGISTVELARKLST